MSVPTQEVAPGLDGLDPYRSGSTEPWTVGLICALVRATRAVTVIETGTFEGLTTIALWRAMDSLPYCTTLYTVESDPVRLETAAKRVLAACGGASTCSVQIHGEDSLNFLARFPAGQADLVFLDDNHDSAHVWREARLALRALRPRGVLCFHDVCGLFALGEIVRELGGVSLDLPRLHAAGGLGIVVKGD